MPDARIAALDPGDVDAAADALAAAFHDDPLQSYVFPDPGERQERSPAHFRPLLRYGLLFGEVLTNRGAPRCAAVWLGPAAWDVTPERAAAAGLDRLAADIGEAPADRFLSAIESLDPFHRQDVPAAHWYLMVVGVAPDAQGRGFGRALIEPVLTRADGGRLPCYLETAQPANVAFYEHLGFRRLRKTVDPRSGLPMWTFRRDPRS